MAALLYKCADIIIIIQFVYIYYRSNKPRTPRPTFNLELGFVSYKLKVKSHPNCIQGMLKNTVSAPDSYGGAMICSEGSGVGKNKNNEN